MKVVLLIGALLVLVPVELYVWFTWVSPFFWSPGIAYTDLAWGWFLFLGIFLIPPFALLEEIIETLGKEENE